MGAAARSARDEKEEGARVRREEKRREEGVTLSAAPISGALPRL